MAGRVNIGAFRDSVTVYYPLSETVTDMGSRTQTFESFDVYADVEQVDSKQLVYLGMNMDAMAFRVKFRSQSTKRPVKILYNGDELTVIITKFDKLNRITNCIAKTQR